MMTVPTNSVRGWLVLAISIALALSARLEAQISPEEHASHHPPPGGAAPAVSATQPGGGMMAGMGEMMGGTPTKEFYPSLMALPDMSPEQRRVIAQAAHQRMESGAARMSDGLSRLARVAGGDDFQAMQEATKEVRQGMAEFDSGLATHRALADGRAPRDVALTWFKQQMNLSAPPVREDHALSGLSLFHTTIMALLVIFAVAMVWMYFFKMRRAALLLQGLTGGAPSPPIAGTALPDRKAPVAVASSSTRFALPTGKKWSGNLRVGRIFEETPDVKTFRLVNPLNGVLPFSYMPGQFVTVMIPIDGKPVKRSYTIASSPTQHDYVEITVKHEDKGVVSGFLHNRVKEGDLLEFSGPFGSFIFTGRECKCILLIGGGVGITPLMSVLRYLTDRSWTGDIYVLYSIHNAQDFIFKEELDYLQKRHPNLRVIVTVSHPEGTDWKGTTGRITKDLITRSVPNLASRYVHLCGPVSMMEAVKKALIELGVPVARIKTEAFGPALGKPEPTMSAAETPISAGDQGQATHVVLPTVSFSQSDKSVPLPPDKTVLDVADECGVIIDNSCRVGTCGTCRVKLLSGKVTMAVEDGLEPDDKGNDIILACQAKSAGDVVVEA